MGDAHLLLMGWAAIAVIMALLWLVQLATRNASTVDVAWAFGTGVLGIYFASASRPATATER